MKLLTVCVIALLTATATLHGAVRVNEIPLVDIKKIDNTIVVDLRYASSNNIARRPLYPPGTRALTRLELAERLKTAQSVLRRYNFGLKIWDAYRPGSVQVQLWRASGNNNFVADPEVGAGSLHSWGLAVDAT